MQNMSTFLRPLALFFFTLCLFEVHIAKNIGSAFPLMLQFLRVLCILQMRFSCTRLKKRNNLIKNVKGFQGSVHTQRKERCQQ